MHARQAPRLVLASQPDEHAYGTKEVGRREREVCASKGGGSNSTPVAEATPRAGVPPGEPLGVRALVPAKIKISDRDHPKEPEVGDRRDRPREKEPTKIMSNNPA